MTSKNDEWWYILGRINGSAQYQYTPILIIEKINDVDYFVYSSKADVYILLTFNDTWRKWKPSWFLRLLGYK